MTECVCADVWALLVCVTALSISLSLSLSLSYTPISQTGSTAHCGLPYAASLLPSCEWADTCGVCV